MEQNTLQDFKIKLLQQKEQIQNKLDTQEQELDVDGDEIDVASGTIIVKVHQDLIKRQINHLRRINDALSRIEEGTFGECEQCGEKISEKRLLAKPETNTCIVCAEKLEYEAKQYA